MAAGIPHSTKKITLAPPLSRDIWSAFGGHGPVWEEVRPSVGSPASGAVCWLHQGEGFGRRGSLPDAGTGQLGQGPAGVFWLRWQASVWQVAAGAPRQPGNGVTVDPVTLCFLLPVAVTQMSTPWRRCWNFTSVSCLNRSFPSLNMKTFSHVHSCWPKMRRRYMHESDSRVFVRICVSLSLLCHCQGIQELGRQVNTLPLPNYNLLQYICK